MEQAHEQAPATCKFCGGSHLSPDSLSDEELRRVAEQMIEGRVAWSPVCQPGMALAHGILRLLDERDDSRREAAARSEDRDREVAARTRAAPDSRR